MAERYSVQFASSGARDFRRLPLDVRRKITSAVDDLSANPRPPGVRKIQGYERHYRIRVGQYRVIYEIDDSARMVSVNHIDHRSAVYRSL